MQSKPLLQVALDIPDAEEALRIAGEVHEFTDILEVGSVLLKKEGVRIIERIKTAYPNKLVFADTKTIDFGRPEAQIVFAAGADIMSVCGIASDETITYAVEEAHSCQKKVLVDLIGLGDTYRQAKRLSYLHPDYIAVPTGIDKRSTNNELFEKVEIVSQISPIPLSISGGILLDDVSYLLMFHPTIIVVGASIVHASKPREVTERFWKSIHTPSLLPPDYENDHEE